MSNLIGKIQGTVKEGKSCIKLNSDIVDINGLEITSDGIFGGFTKGMVVQVKHKDYKKTVTKSGTGWSAIDNNLETGFVVAIKPSSSASNVLVSCNLQIGLQASHDARYWGARLYRKIGNGDWTRVTEAENNDSVAGTPVWLSDGMGVGASGHADDFQISNLGNSFLDSPNTTETVYYTIYWKCKLGQNDGDANVVLRLNRAHEMNNLYSALPISNITAQEIWNSGTVYRPDNNLITLDQSDNNVDISGTLNVQGEKVMTVPALDICGNDLSANTTYEITTGPPGSINNISFVKKYHLSARSAARELGGGHDTIINWTIDTESAGASSLNTTSGVWTCPATGVYWIYYETFYAGTRFQQTDTRLMVSGTAANIYRFTPYRSDGDGRDTYVDDVGDVAIPISIMRPLSAGITVYLTMRVLSYADMYGSATLYVQRIN